MHYLVFINENIIVNISVETACPENSTDCSLDLSSYFNMTAAESQFTVRVAAENVFGRGLGQICGGELPISGKY